MGLHICANMERPDGRDTSMRIIGDDDDGDDNVRVLNSHTIFEHKLVYIDHYIQVIIIRLNTTISPSVPIPTAGNIIIYNL